MDCQHELPENFGSNDVHYRADGTAWVHLPCASCGEYRVFELELI
jgi:hypothetical protein